MSSELLQACFPCGKAKILDDVACLFRWGCASNVIEICGYHNCWGSGAQLTLSSPFNYIKNICTFNKSLSKIYLKFKGGHIPVVGCEERIITIRAQYDGWWSFVVCLRNINPDAITSDNPVPLLPDILHFLRTNHSFKPTHHHPRSCRWKNFNKPWIYPSSKLWVTQWVTGAKCRATTSEAKKLCQLLRKQGAVCTVLN